MIVLLEPSILKLPEGSQKSKFVILQLSKFQSPFRSLENQTIDGSEFDHIPWVCTENTGSETIDKSDKYVLIASLDNLENFSSVLMTNPSILLGIFLGDHHLFQLNPHHQYTDSMVICLFEKSQTLKSVLHLSSGVSSCNILTVITSNRCLSYPSCGSRSKPLPSNTRGDGHNTLAEFCESYSYMNQTIDFYRDLVLNKCCPVTQHFRIKVVLFQKFIDIISGLLMVWLIFTNAENINQTFQKNVQVLVNATLQLLDTLMNNPGGLKLNHGLAIFLGKFYTYHVWLWAEYIKLLANYSTPVLKALACFGCCGGITFQIALLQDLISILTMHLVCFYIYSSRLYNLCTSSMLMLWRLFRGKKWNVLRERLDSAEYDLEQLFIGTLFFTVALFLIPTVLVFYLVFGTFYVGLCVVHITLTYVQNLVRYNYLLIHLLLLFRSPLLTTSGSLVVVENGDPNLTVLKYGKLNMAKYREVIDALLLPESKHTMDSTDILKRFITGAPLVAPAKA